MSRGSIVTVSRLLDEYDVVYSKLDYTVFHYIMLYQEYLQNVQLQTTSPESIFPNEYIGVIFIQINQHLKKLLKKYKGVPILWNMV